MIKVAEKFILIYLVACAFVYLLAMTIQHFNTYGCKSYIQIYLNSYQMLLANGLYYINENTSKFLVYNSHYCHYKRIPI
uniref:Putative secreted protein n=1 Tax=Xenopsylla cheopis TaxID=163159 RepID=A0A6M2E313_XENCH